jgi:hypothetical protein
MALNNSSLSLSLTVLESAMPNSREGGGAAACGGSITKAAATTGPAKGPRPASSTPMTKCVVVEERQEFRARSSRVRGREGGRDIAQEELLSVSMCKNREVTVVGGRGS